jgi:hypothetical protein
MLLVLGIIEFGRIIYSYNAISNAAREGARFAVVPANQADIPGGPEWCASWTNPIVGRVCERAMALDLAELQVTVSHPDLDANGIPEPDMVQVQAVYEGPFLTNLILQAVNQGGLRLQAAATMRLE